MKKNILFIVILFSFFLFCCNNNLENDEVLDLPEGTYYIKIHYSLNEKSDEIIYFTEEDLINSTIGLNNFNLPGYDFLGYFEVGTDVEFLPIYLRNFNLETRYYKRPENYAENYSKGFTEASLIRERFFIGKDKDGKEIFKEDFGGTYRNYDGRMTVAIVEDADNQEDIKFLEENDITFVFVKFSYNYLESIWHPIQPILDEIDYTMAGIEVEKNYYEICMRREDKVDFLKNYLSNLGYDVENALNIIASKYCSYIELMSTEINDGDVSYKYISDSLAYSTTICSNAVKNLTGELGVITCGHLGTVDTEVYYDTTSLNLDYSKPLGIISDSIIGNCIDGAFIPFENQSEWTISPDAVYNETLFNNIKLGNNCELHIGDEIIIIGQTSGIVYSKITNINKEGKINGISVNESFRIRDLCQPGDSGAPIFLCGNDGYLYLIGLYYGNDNAYRKGLGCKISNIMSQLNVTPITNDSFNITNLSNNTIQLNGVNFSISGYFNIIPSVYGKTITKIGLNAFDGYNYMTGINIPSDVEIVDNEAFSNCSNLSEVKINKKNLPLTSLGNDVFAGCSSSLQIKVPNDRIADYKNMTNWSTYSNKIVPFTNDFTTINMSNSTNTTQTLTLDAGCNKLYKLNVVDQGMYDVKASTSANTTIKLYDNNYILLETKSKLLTKTLSIGTYYVSIEYQNSNQSGTLNPLFCVHSNHTYDDHYVWTSLTNHKSYCVCGNYVNSAHIVSSSAYLSGLPSVPCMLCHGLASVAEISHQSIETYPHTINGSFILQNGVIILVDEDIEGYLNGTLIFLNGNIMMNSNKNVYCLSKREEYAK